ncbi:MAG: 4Fe-4S dicluster domain-containing protein [Candidatus Bathyarchaeia archaeon]
MKAFIVDPKKCTECGLCELVCSYSKEHEFNPRKSRIYVTSKEIRVCRHCKKPPCIEACKLGAIVKNDLTGAVLIDEQKCIGCKACIPACPFGGILLTPETKVIKCDLCDGDPNCVKYCFFDAIKWILP